jgi:hypothetical protein
MGESEDLELLEPPPGLLDDEDDDPSQFDWVDDADFDLLDPDGRDDAEAPECLMRGEAAADAADRGWGDPEWGDPDEGSIEQLVSRMLKAGADPAGMSDLGLGDGLAEWQAIEAMAAARKHKVAQELMTRRQSRKWDRRAGWKDGHRERLNAPDEGYDPATGQTWTDGIGGSGNVRATREAEEETALALTCTQYAARALIELTYDLVVRLPATYAELTAGRATETKAKIVAGYAQDLDDADAAKMDKAIAPDLDKLTTGELRDRLARLLISLDAAAAERRRQRSERSAKVALYGNTEGTASLVIDRIPAALGAAARARINALARMYKKAGVQEPIAWLEAKIAVGLLLGVLPSIPLPGGEDGGGPLGGDGGGSGAGGAGGAGGGPYDPWTGPDDPGPEDLWPEEPTPEDPWPEGQSGDPRPGDASDADDTSIPDVMPWPGVPASADGTGPGCAVIPPGLRPNDPGRIKLTVPWRSLLGIGPEAGDLTWLGPVTPGSSRALALAAAADPNAAFHLIITDEAGHAIGYRHLRARRTTDKPGLVSDVTLTITAANAAAHARIDDLRGWCESALAKPAAAELARLLAKAVTVATEAAAEAERTAELNAVAGGCAHTMQTSSYQITGRLRQWLNVRDGTCRNPICRRPAAGCDQDHTRPFHQGGRSCTCNLGGECRSHHQAKQLPGWLLTQDADGYFTWHTPSGTYREEPHRYPV